MSWIFIGLAIGSLTAYLVIAQSQARGDIKTAYTGNTCIQAEDENPESILRQCDVYSSFFFFQLCFYPMVELIFYEAIRRILILNRFTDFANAAIKASNDDSLSICQH